MSYDLLLSKIRLNAKKTALNDSQLNNISFINSVGERVKKSNVTFAEYERITTQEIKLRSERNKLNDKLFLALKNGEISKESYKLFKQEIKNILND